MTAAASSEIIRAEIVNKQSQPYQVGDIKAATLTGLCIALLKAGYPPDAEVQCFRPGKAAWDIRAKSIGAAAQEASGRDEGLPSAPGRACPERRTQTPRMSLTGLSQNGAPIFKPKNLIWHGLRLRLQSSNRDLCVVGRDVEYPELFRVHFVDHISDLLNLSRAKDAAVRLALSILNQEAAHKQTRKHHRTRAWQP
jgi:hypothetical protein